MTFQEFLELNSDQKYITLDNFYRDHLYLRTLAKRFYGDDEHQLGTCIFTKDGDFLRSRPTGDDAFKSNCSTVLFRKDVSAIFFDSEEAVSIYKRMTDTLESPHYHLSKAEIVEIIEEDLESQISEVKNVIDDYHTQISLHQNRVDYLDQMRIDLRKAATLEDQVLLIEDLLTEANAKLASTKFKFVVAEVLDKDLILDHDGGDVYTIHFEYNDRKTVLSKMSDDREKISAWMKEVLARLDFYVMISDQFESRLVYLNRSELNIRLRVNEYLEADVVYMKTLNTVEILVNQSIDSQKVRLNDHADVKIYESEEVYFVYSRESELYQIYEVLQDIDYDYREHIVI